MTGMIAAGATVGFFQGDVKKLVDDIGALRPTILAGVPRVFDKIYESINAKVEGAGGLKRALFNSAFKSREKLRVQGKKDNSLLGSVAFKKAKNKLGGRVRLIVSGGGIGLYVIANISSTF